MKIDRTLLQRAFQCSRAYLGLGRLNRESMSLLGQPTELIALLSHFNDGFLDPLQIEQELALLIEDVATLGPKTVIEIGSYAGGTLYLWTRLAQKDAIIVSIDLPGGHFGGEFGGGYSRLRVPVYKRFAGASQRLHLIRANSHERTTLHEVKRIFDGKPVDMIFIDGDHTYEGVKLDWEMYANLVRPGGLIAFHDVAGNYDDTQVKSFWDSIKGGYVYREYVTNPGGKYGIGVIVK